MRLIEFCVNNLTPEVSRIKEELEADPELDVIDYDCTSQLYRLCRAALCLGGWRIDDW